MAKKKQKQNNHSSKKGSNKHKDPPRSRLDAASEKVIAREQNASGMMRRLLPS